MKYKTIRRKIEDRLFETGIWFSLRVRYVWHQYVLRPLIGGYVKDRAKDGAHEIDRSIRELLTFKYMPHSVIEDMVEDATRECKREAEDGYEELVDTLERLEREIEDVDTSIDYDELAREVDTGSLAEAITDQGITLTVTLG